MHLASHQSTCRDEQDYKTWQCPLACSGGLHPITLAFQTVPPFRISTLSGRWTRYISLSACRDLGLVQVDFQHPPPLIAAVDGLEYEAVHQDMITLLPRLWAMPLLPLEKDVPRLQEWLLGHFSVSTFNSEWYLLPVMIGPPRHITDAVPYAFYISHLSSQALGSRSQTTK